MKENRSLFLYFHARSCMKSNGRHNIEKLQHLFWRHTSSEARYRSPASLRIEKKVCSKPRRSASPSRKTIPTSVARMRRPLTLSVAEKRPPLTESVPSAVVSPPIDDPPHGHRVSAGIRIVSRALPRCLRITDRPDRALCPPRRSATRLLVSFLAIDP